MAENDNSQLKIEQLTEAVKGLYAKSSVSQGEIYNALTDLSQRYENLTNVTGEKLAATIVSEFRKTIDIRYNDTSQNLKNLENQLKNLLSANNEGFNKNLNEFIENVASLHQKINSQQSAFVEIVNKIERANSEEMIMEVSKLSENFHSFSRGFENITTTLNKNFADFLNQIKRFDPKDEINLMKSEMATVTTNVNNAIRSIETIDKKYISLADLIESITQKEGEFSKAVDEFKLLTKKIESVKDGISNISSKQDLELFQSEIKEKLENLKIELKNSSLDDEDGPKGKQAILLSKDIAGLNNEIQNLGANFSDAKGEVALVKNAIGSVDVELKEVKSMLDTRLPSVLGDSANELYLEKTKEELKELIVSLASFKDDIIAISEGNVKILQEPIEKAIEGLKNQDLGKSITELSGNLNKVTSEVQLSIQNFQKTLSTMNNASSVQILTQISEAIPAISDRIELLRTQMLSKPAANPTVKESSNDVFGNIQDTLRVIADKINQDAKNINLETITILKVELQRLSDCVEDNVRTLNIELKKEFNDFKADFRDLSIKQITGIDKIQDKLLLIESLLKNSYSGGNNSYIDNIAYKTSSAPTHSAIDLDVLSSFKGDILEVVLSAERGSKSAYSRFENKVDKLLITLLGNVESVCKKPLGQTLIDIDNKIEKTNLQQIHNAKELLEEIQSGHNIINGRLENLEDNNNIEDVIDLVSKIQENIDKIQTNTDKFQSSNTDIVDNINEFKEQIVQKLKETIQKISAIAENSGTQSAPVVQNDAIEALVEKVQEYISNFEHLKGRISQEIKENLTSEFSKVQTSIKALRTTDENSNYTYTLEDVESDLAKIRLTIEKGLGTNDNFKTIFEKIVELRTVGLENVKINRDVESELGQISSWFKETVDKLDDIQERMDEIQNTGFEDIKTRLVQSDKTRLAANEFNTKIENALKHLIKNSQIQENKINELSKKLEVLQENQTESFNPGQFIDIFYENMTQTKMLANRVEIIEDKISSIQSAVDKLISYVEN